MLYLINPSNFGPLCALGFHEIHNLVWGLFEDPTLEAFIRASNSSTTLMKWSIYPLRVSFLPCVILPRTTMVMGCLFLTVKWEVKAWRRLCQKYYFIWKGLVLGYWNDLRPHGSIDMIIVKLIVYVLNVFIWIFSLVIITPKFYQG